MTGFWIWESRSAIIPGAAEGRSEKTNAVIPSAAKRSRGTSEAAAHGTSGGWSVGEYPLPVGQWEHEVKKQKDIGGSSTALRFAQNDRIFRFALHTSRPNVPTAPRTSPLNAPSALRSAQNDRIFRFALHTSRPNVPTAPRTSPLNAPSPLRSAQNDRILDVGEPIGQHTGRGGGSERKNKRCHPERSEAESRDLRGGGARDKWWLVRGRVSSAGGSVGARDQEAEGYWRFFDCAALRSE